MTTTGEKIMDVELTDHNCSEVLRIFIKARNCKDNEVQIKLLQLFFMTQAVSTLSKFQPNDSESASQRGGAVRQTT